MDKNYKIIIQDFCRLPILSDDVFKAMDKNNDGEVSKVHIFKLWKHFEKLSCEGRVEACKEAFNNETDSVNNVEARQQWGRYNFMEGNEEIKLPKH